MLNVPFAKLVDPFTSFLDLVFRNHQNDSNEAWEVEARRSWEQQDAFFLDQALGKLPAGRDTRKLFKLHSNHHVHRCKQLCDLNFKSRAVEHVNKPPLGIIGSSP